MTPEVFPPSKAHVTLRAGLILLAFFCAAWLGLSRQFYTEAIVDAFFALALASVIIVHLRVHPSWLDAALIAAGAAALGTIHFAILHDAPKVMAWFSFAGLTSFTILSVRSIWGFEQRRLVYAWAPAALFVASDYFAATLLEWTSRTRHFTFDLYLLSFDASLGRLISFDVGRAYAQVPWFHICALIAYIGLALPIAMVYAGRLVRHGKAALPVMWAFIAAGPLGVVFYNVFPACGPRDLLRAAFPFNAAAIPDLSRLVLEPVAITGPRNAMPSLHLAWTLLAWWYSKGLSPLERIIAFAFLAWTAIATLGTGEHYLADLIVAFPFALMIQALCSAELRWTQSLRSASCLLGLGGTVVWLVLLRFTPRLFWLSPLLPWTLSAATVVGVCWQQARLSAEVAAHDPR